MTAIDATADKFVEKQNADSLSAYFRRQRFALVLRQIKEIYRRKGKCTIADIGGREEYWAPALHKLEDYNAHVTIINLEQTQSSPGQRFSFRFGDACNLTEFGEHEYDLAHSNSLIEHVGTWDNMESCAREIGRVAEEYYVQTPYFWFPIEPHFRAPFFHWLPEQVRARLVMAMKLGYFNRAENLGQAMRNVQSCCLIDQSQFQQLFLDGEVRFERVAGLAKSLIVQRQGASSAANCR